MLVANYHLKKLQCFSHDAGDYYLRLLLEESEESDESIAIKKSYVFLISVVFSIGSSMSCDGSKRSCDWCL